MGKDEVLEAIKGLTVVELADLVMSLEEEFGVSAAAFAAPVAATAAAAPTTETASSANADEEKTDFSVVLTEAGPNKINVIKAVREVTTLGLREAKDLVEGAPKSVQEGIGKEDAQQIKEKLEAAGATVTIE